MSCCISCITTELRRDFADELAWPEMKLEWVSYDVPTPSVS